MQGVTENPLQSSLLGRVLGMFLLWVVVTDLPGKMEPFLPLLRSHLGENSMVFPEAWTHLSPGDYYYYF